MMVQKKFSEDEKSEEEKSKTYDAKIYQESDSSSFKCDKKSLKLGDQDKSQSSTLMSSVSLEDNQKRRLKQNN